MDQMVTHFTTKRPTKRWTYAFFCNMFDVMPLAAFGICKEVDWLKNKDARRTFLTTLANSLVLPTVENRMNKFMSSSSSLVVQLLNYLLVNQSI